MTLIRKERIYFDSSVIGGYFDAEFSEESKRVIEYARDGRIIVLMSEIVIQEILKAPRRVQEVLTSLPSATLERIELTPEIISLRDAYLAVKIVAPRWTDDATHVAAATIARADAIVSWNFTHIVRLDKMRAYNTINLLNGYGILTIISPREVRYDDPATE
jgi:predicted nucleic acid-binding protein